MNRLVKLMQRTGLPVHECAPFPHCPICLPKPPSSTPVEVRIAAVKVLRAHGPDPLSRRCICGLNTNAYYDHVVEELAGAGALRTDRDLPS